MLKPQHAGKKGEVDKDGIWKTPETMKCRDPDGGTE